MTLEAIDITGFKPADLRDQPVPSNIWAKVADLIIDRRYQREITAAGRKAIQRIADDWDWKKYQPIIVAPSEGGLMAVVDGQHRAHAAAVLGLEAIPAMTVPMTPSEQAAGFVSINRDRIRIDAHSIYRAELAAGVELALMARDAVGAAGCTLARSKPSQVNKKPGSVFAIGLIRKMVEGGEADAVTVGLRAIRQSEAGADLDAYNGSVLAVWLSAIARNQQFMSLDLSKIFDSMDVMDLLDVSRRRSRETGTPARTLAIDHVARVLSDQKAAAA